jgi:prepilin-type N-terminal cleavage/methylation domain-containing protein
VGERLSRAINRAQERDEGFTLIELLVVIVILGILAAVVVFSVAGIGDKGKKASYATDARTVRTAEEAFCAKNGRYGTSAELVSGGFLASPSTYHGVAPVAGTGCTGAGDTSKGSFVITCDSAEDACTAGGATPVAEGVTQSLAAEPFSQSRWGERIASAGLPGPLGGNIQGGDLDGDGVPDFWTSETKKDVPGATNAGKVYAVSGKTLTVIYSINPPTPQSGVSFGFWIAPIGDLNGDGVNDLGVGTDAQSVGAGCLATGVPQPNPPSCFEKEGQAWTFNGANGALLHTFNNPVQQGRSGNQGRFGYRIVSAGDIVKADGTPGHDGVPEILIPGALNDVCATAGCTAAVTAAAGTAGTPANAGDLACADVTPFPAGCRQDQGQVFIFNGANSNLVRTLDMPATDYFNGPNTGVYSDDVTCKQTFPTCGSFGIALSATGDVNGDGIDDQSISAIYYAKTINPALPHCGSASPNTNCAISQGRMYQFSGNNGSLLATFDTPDPQIVSPLYFGYQDVGFHAPGDVNGDGVPDIYADGLGATIPASALDASGPGGYQGLAYVFDGKASVLAGHGVLLYRIPDPQPTQDHLWGYGMRTTDYDLDGHPDMIIGSVPGSAIGVSPPADQSGVTALIRGSNGAVFKLLSMPAAYPPQPGDGYPDYASSAPFQDLPISGTMSQDVGVILIFRSPTFN